MIRLAVPLLMAALMALMSCQLPGKSDPPPDGGLEGYSLDAEFTGRTACEKRGGTFTRAGKTGGLVCIETPADAGKACTAGSQCDGMCLARTNSCAPVKPLFGCHDILTDNGTRATICTD